MSSAFQPQPFDESRVLHDLHHYLPAQAPLKDFIHHNTLHAFQHQSFFEALNSAAELFGYKVLLSLNEFRKLYRSGKINQDILNRVIDERKGTDQRNAWLELLINHPFDHPSHCRIGEIRTYWKTKFRVDLDALVHPILFRTLCSYLDQGIAMWRFPEAGEGFLEAIKALEKNSFTSLFRGTRARSLLFENRSMTELLDLLVGDPSLYEHYVFDQQFAHQGWSGMVASIEQFPETMLDFRRITLHDLIVFELLLELDALDMKIPGKWQPLGSRIKHPPYALFAPVAHTELNQVLFLWQEAFEWTYYDQVLRGIEENRPAVVHPEKPSFQAAFCIDDRECSLRRHIEALDTDGQTFGTPGFFGVEFFYQPQDGKFYTKLCPAPVTPKYLIKETGSKDKRQSDVHFHHRTHALLPGWLIAQTLGFWSALKLFGQIFRPSMSPATATSFKHMDRFSSLTIENHHGETENGLQIGFTLDEMTQRVEALLKSIGLVDRFAPLVYMIGHGSSSVNNPHFAAYDCGACSGRPGSVNARVICYMANHPGVREALKARGIQIPPDTQFVGGLHDTTRDEMVFYDEASLSPENKSRHHANLATFQRALDENALERSRRFFFVDTGNDPHKVHERVMRRSVSLFEPRPELNHATNALCCVGRRDMTEGLFLDRRSFLNSYNYNIDPEGNFLFNILKAAAPVCGGINLEYFFSRVDNSKLGAGSKLPHNVMGLFGVANGIDGDLRPGLPSQMIEVHDPIRLLLIVEHYSEVILKTIQRNAETYEWFKNNWVHLVAVNPDNKAFSRFNPEKEHFETYQTLTPSIPHINNLKPLFESEHDNLPVMILSAQ